MDRGQSPIQLDFVTPKLAEIQHTIMNGKQKRRTPAMLLLFATLWIGGIAVGSLALWDHEFSEGESNDAPTELPPSLSALASLTKPLTIFMAIHPDCPCTRASLEQVDQLIARNRESIQLIGLVRKSEKDANARQLEQGTYWQRLVAIPNARPVADIDGALAALLGTHVSGATIGYDQTGRLRFQGGMSASRGHAGPSRGMDELEAIARQLAPLELCSTPTFGCSLENDPDFL